VQLECSACDTQNYRSDRNHQGLTNQLINPEAGHPGNAGEIQRRQRLSGMLTITTAPPEL
jgi:hypothetical protein